MRVEDITGVMKYGDDKTPNIILICEDELESMLVDKLGKIGDRVCGELRLADGYGEFYIRLEPQPKPDEFTKEVSDFIFAKYGDISPSEFSKSIDYLIKASSIIRCQQAEIERR